MAIFSGGRGLLCLSQPKTYKKKKQQAWIEIKILHHLKVTIKVRVSCLVLMAMVRVSGWVVHCGDESPQIICVHFSLL